MGRVKKNHPRKPAPVPVPRQTTHEPVMPLPGWPGSHVSVELTDDEFDECVLVTVHGVDHYLHATTARELQKALEGKLEAYNATVDAVNEIEETRIPHA